MRLTVPIAAMLLFGCASPHPYATVHHDQELGGRTAGASQRCIPAQDGEELHVADNDRHILLYGSGKTIWASHLQGLCGFSQDDQLMIYPRNGEYCSGQLVRSLEVSRAEGPSCVLGDFTPYARKG